MLGKFISVREPNIKYLGLENMVRLAEVPAVADTINRCFPLPCFLRCVYNQFLFFPTVTLTSTAPSTAMYTREFSRMSGC